MSASIYRTASPTAQPWICSLILFLVHSLTYHGCQSMPVRWLFGRSYGFVSPLQRPASLRQTSLNGAIAGIQPSGELHIGNYIGCIHPAVQYQNEKGDLIFMVADLHATTGNNQSVIYVLFTGRQENGRLNDMTKKTVATLLACGIDPTRTSVILQSEFPSILELHWILGTVISLGRLRKLANFERREVARDSDNMAADVLGSGCDTVIAGPDQECHVNLIREVAEKLNRQISEDLLRIPKLYVNSGFRVLSLDGAGKMSKSNVNDSRRVNLLDSSDAIAEKLRSAKTSTSRDASSPEVENLFRLYSFFSSEPLPDVANDTENFQFSILKDKLHRSMTSHLGGIQRRYEDLVKNEDTLRQALSAGKTRMLPVFESIVERVKHRSHYYKT
ncbi:tRNA synthetases class I (W and Y) family protein [Babesia divergens]|uniref:tryptophan--tRNA ligase n=1 Tax=Babesia divergens TaxID=32595 RepID=A0AAD9LEJ1_BABDI|nr:tRNA synthetases class I (W and Y) family protein [Babesia divergens]